jgi:eukaryotic-like serine/threonine-protein kinase
MRPRGAGPWLSLALLAIGVVAVLIVFVALAADEDEDRRAEARVAVPDVTGLDLATAGARTEERALVADAFPVDDESEAGLVIGQDPPAGRRVGRGTIVRLNVATGTERLAPVEVPDVTGIEAGEARRRLWEQALTTRTVLRDAPAPGEVGEVLDQAPAAGESATALTQVTLYVGR